MYKEKDVSKSSIDVVTQVRKIGKKGKCKPLIAQGANVDEF